MAEENGNGNNHKIRHHKKKAFLAAYALYGNITKAAEIAEINRHTHYAWLKNDENYVAAFEDAENEAADTLEGVARERAIDGVEKPIYFKGQYVGTIKEPSDTLLIFLLKGARPHKFRDTSHIELTGNAGGPIEINDARERIASRLAEYAARQSAQDDSGGIVK